MIASLYCSGVIFSIRFLVDFPKSFLAPDLSANKAIADSSIEGIAVAYETFPEAFPNTPAGPTSVNLLPDIFDWLTSLSPLRDAATNCVK